MHGGRPPRRRDGPADMPGATIRDHASPSTSFIISSSSLILAYNIYKWPRNIARAARRSRVGAATVAWHSLHPASLAYADAAAARYRSRDPPRAAARPAERPSSPHPRDQGRTVATALSVAALAAAPLESIALQAYGTEAMHHATKVARRQEHAAVRGGPWPRRVAASPHAAARERPVRHCGGSAVRCTRRRPAAWSRGSPGSACCRRRDARARGAAH